jgi:hypothetical protein
MVYESQISCQKHNHGRQQVFKELVALYFYRNNEHVRSASILKGNKVGRFRGTYYDICVHYGVVLNLPSFVFSSIAVVSTCTRSPSGKTHTT